MTRVALDVRRAGDVTEDEHVRRGAVHEPERHARVGRVHERALALDDEQLAPTLGSLDDEPLGGAGDEVRDDRVDCDPPARDRDPGLAGRDELGVEPAPPRLAVELDRDGLLADRAVRADRERLFAASCRFSPVGTLRSGGGLRRSWSSTPCWRRARPARRRRRGTRGGRSRRRGRPRSSRQQLAPGRREAPALGGDADERRRRAVGEPVLDGADDRDALVAPPARSESTMTTVGCGL